MLTLRFASQGYFGAHSCRWSVVKVGFLLTAALPLNGPWLLSACGMPALSSQRLRQSSLSSSGIERTDFSSKDSPQFKAMQAITKSREGRPSLFWEEDGDEGHANRDSKE